MVVGFAATLSMVGCNGSGSDSESDGGAGQDGSSSSTTMDGGGDMGDTMGATTGMDGGTTGTDGGTSAGTTGTDGGTSAGDTTDGGTTGDTTDTGDTGDTTGTDTTGGVPCGTDGTASVTTSVVMDPCGHEPFINLPISEDLTITIQGNVITIAGSGADPQFLGGTGTVDTMACTAEICGTGTFAGFADIDACYFLDLDTSTVISGGSYVVGENGMLPGGCPITYSLAI